MRYIKSNWMNLPLIEMWIIKHIWHTWMHPKKWYDAKNIGIYKITKASSIIMRAFFSLEFVYMWGLIKHTKLGYHHRVNFFRASRQSCLISNNMILNKGINLCHLLSMSLDGQQQLWTNTFLNTSLITRNLNVQGLKNVYDSLF